MPNNTTKYWAQQFDNWWKETGSKSKRPRIPNDLKEGYLRAQTAEIESGVERTPLTYREGRIASIEKRGGDQGLKVVYSDTRDVKGANRRAGEKAKTISIQERTDWYKRNLYANPEKRAIADDAADKKGRAKLKSDIRKQNQSIEDPKKKRIYEHLSPLNGPEELKGGFESARNTVSAPAYENGVKSDKLASTKVLREQGVPVTRSGAIRADALKIPLPDGESRFNAIYDDITTYNRPSAKKVKANLEKLKLKSFVRKVPALAGIVAAGGTLLNGGGVQAAAREFIDAENPLNNLDSGAIFNESQDYSQALKAAAAQNAKPLLERLKAGALGGLFPSAKKGSRSRFD